MHQTLSIINKGHIFMNFDGMILTFYIWICVVHCVHRDKCLKTLHYKFGRFYQFILHLFCTESQIINADLEFQHFKLLRFTNKIEFLFSLVFNMPIIHCSFHVS